MQTLLEVLKKTTAFLEKKGIPNPRLEAELIFSHALDCRRLDLYLRFEQPLEETKLARLRSMIRRRAKREPLQYIIGAVDFFNIRLKVDKRALIPRPETEELLEKATHLLSPPPRSILDLGTGSGALALALAEHYPGARVTAVEKSEAAMALAMENIVSCGEEGRVDLLQSDWFEAVQGRFDLIVANPPYLGEEEWNDCAPEVKDHEPYEALVSDRTGMENLEKIIGTAPPYLERGGLLALETGIAQRRDLIRAAGEAGFSRWETHKDLRQRDRFFLAWK